MSSDQDNKGVFGQRFDANGSAVGAEFQVNTATTGDQKASTVMALSGSPSTVLAPILTELEALQGQIYQITVDLENSVSAFALDVDLSLGDVRNSLLGTDRIFDNIQGTFLGVMNVLNSINNSPMEIQTTLGTTSMGFDDINDILNGVDDTFASLKAQAEGIDVSSGDPNVSTTRVLTVERRLAVGVSTLVKFPSQGNKEEGFVPLIDLEALVNGKASVESEPSGIKEVEELSGSKEGTNASRADVDSSAGVPRLPNEPLSHQQLAKQVIYQASISEVTSRLAVTSQLLDLLV